MKKIAIITGASSGMGRCFVETLSKYGEIIDEVWVVARREERLQNLNCKYITKPIPMDLSSRRNLEQFRRILSEEKPEVRLLINASGFGKMGSTEELPLSVQLNMMDLNCGAVMAMCHMCIPYMSEGSNIINIASVAGDQPIPYMNCYAATKAFVLRFSRGLNRELKSRGIHVMAMCPFWTKTGFFNDAEAGKKTIVKKYTAMYEPIDVVRRAWEDLKKGKDVSRYGFVARFQSFGAKVFSHKVIMDYWEKQQGLLDE